MVPYPDKNVIRPRVERGQNLSGIIYDKLKDRLIDGDLEPGSIILENDLAADFGVSRTPAREALKRLAIDNLIVWEDRKRAIVSEIFKDDVLELFLMREMIEPFAAKKIIEGGNPQLLAGLLATTINEMETLKDNHVELMKKDGVFHSTIIDYVGVKKLSQMWSRIYDEMTRVAIYSLHAKRKPETIISEHREIMEGFWNRDLKRTLNAIKTHHSNILTAYKAKHDYANRKIGLRPNDLL